MTRPHNIPLSVLENAKREARDAMIATGRSAKGMITYSELTSQIASIPLQPDSEVPRELLSEIPTAEDAAGRGMIGFKAHPHMLRHACGYALANKGHDTRALQAYLGHRNIQHTVRYTELSPTRFKNFWRS
jgi:integrase